MIQTEILEDMPHLVRTYSDAGFKIRQNGTGIIYDDAVDPIVMERTYTETDIPIEKPEVL